MTGISQLSAGHVTERMLLQNAIMFPPLALSPTRRNRRKQFDLSAEAEPATILCLHPVGQLVSERQVMRDTLENAEKQLVKIVGGKSLAPDPVRQRQNGSLLNQLRCVGGLNPRYGRTSATHGIPLLQLTTPAGQLRP